MSVCDVCKSEVESVWICSMPACPHSKRAAETRKRYIEIKEGWGQPELEKNPHHERY